jgi:putative protease
MYTPEVLAPAGSPETLAAALRSGADAVYLGGKCFSARNSADNFSDEELAEAVRLCHKYGAKADLAVNTVISDGEADDFCNFIRYAASVGIDAFIVQDWGCAELIRRTVPDAVLHGSTQMSVHTASGAKLLSQLGYARVVPARECDSRVLADICAEDIETEVFVHGALCMSVSGQCYMSAVMGSRSANRGRCGQACRLPYSAIGHKGHCALSLKDLSLLPKAEELRDMGVDSLKIEGRMKRPEYSASAVHELKAALSGQAPDMALLKGIFSRSGFTDGYFTGKRQDMFGVREKEDVTAAQGLIPKIHEYYRFERKVCPTDIHVNMKNGEKLTVTGRCGDITERVTGDIPDKAMNRPTDTAALEKQFSKLGDTIFTLGRLTADVEDGLFVPAGKLNELRRELCERLTEAVIQRNTPVYTVTDYAPKLPEARVQRCTGELPLRVYCRTSEQVSAALEKAQYVIADYKLWERDIPDIPRDKAILSPPRFIADEAALTARLSQLKAEGFGRLYCHTPDCIAIGKKLGMKLHGSFTLNVYNSYSAEYLHSIGLEDCVFSFEASLEQIAAVRTHLPIGAAVYGRLPLMLTRNCPIRNEVGDCGKCTGHLTDRTGRDLPVVCNKDSKEILNPDILYMTDRLGDMRNISYGLVILHNETADEAAAVLSGVKPKGSITRGLYIRGIL